MLNLELSTGSVNYRCNVNVLRSCHLRQQNGQRRFVQSKPDTLVLVYSYIQYIITLLDLLMRIYI